MKIIRNQEVKKELRPYGRTVKRLLSHSFKTPVHGIVVFLCKLPDGRFDKHYHSKSSEIIIYPKGGQIRVNNRLYNMKEWDLVLLDPGDVHSCDVAGKSAIQLAIKLSDKDDKVKVN